MPSEPLEGRTACRHLIFRLLGSTRPHCCWLLCSRNCLCWYVCPYFPTDSHRQSLPTSCKSCARPKAPLLRYRVHIWKTKSKTYWKLHCYWAHEIPTSGSGSLSLLTLLVCYLPHDCIWEICVLDWKGDWFTCKNFRIVTFGLGSRVYYFVCWTWWKIEG